MSDGGRSVRVLELKSPPPLLPLPVELDAGGEGNPDDPGLLPALWGSGTGRSGRNCAAGLLPRNIAESGRLCLVARAGREVI